jgi:tRNA (adenine57-N1/adenine58-N1)-methyltransferase catalytic subunit
MLSIRTNNKKESPLPWNLHGTHAQDGDLVQLVGLSHKHFILRLKTGGVFQTHRGVLQHDDMIGKAWGTQIFSHNGSPFFLLQPALADLLRGIKRNTQILYPKDIGYILVTMGIGPGMHILEAGTGSGALTCAFAYAVGREGQVTTYEARAPMQEMARSNLEKLELAERVNFKLGDVAEGFEERDVDALFLDLPNPFDYIPQVRAALKPGGFFGTILPTVNQVEKLLIALRQNRFAFIDVCELLLRFYKAEPSRFRPADRMVAHTGFLIFARPVEVDEERTNRALLRETGLISEVDAAEEADAAKEADAAEAAGLIAQDELDGEADVIDEGVREE